MYIVLLYSIILYVVFLVIFKVCLLKKTTNKVMPHIDINLPRVKKQLAAAPRRDRSIRRWNLERSPNGLHPLPKQLSTNGN